MANETAHALQQTFTGATYGGGLAWLTTNSSAITAIAVATTAIASLYFGYENKKSARRNAIANEERNKVNHRDITDDIIKKVKNSGKPDKLVEELIEIIRK